MTLEEFRYIVKEAYGNRDRYVGIDDFPEQITEVEEDNWTDDGKYSYSSAVYKCDQGNHFMVHSSRSGSYYSDYYYSEPSVTQVEPKVETITRVVWKEVK